MDTWRVNESPQEARENFASRLKPWVRFRPRMIFFSFFFQKIKRKLSPPPPLRPRSKLRPHRDTWRVNESPREARENFASRLKPWVRFRPRMIFFFFFSKNEEEAIPPPLRPRSKLESWGTNNIYYIGIPIQQVKK